jgi:hypothetical protein
MENGLRHDVIKGCMSTSGWLARRHWTEEGGNRRSANQEEEGQISHAGIKNVVLVHGGFVDGSGWQGVYDALKKDGYRVSVVQNPTTSLADDVAVTRRTLAAQDGPAILVGFTSAVGRRGARGRRQRAGVEDEAELVSRVHGRPDDSA